MERRNVSIATVGLTLLLMSCTGGVRACGTTDQGTPASATVTAGVTSSGAGKLGESPKSAQTPAATQPSSTTAPPAAPPPGLGTLGDLPKIAPTPAGTTDVAAAALARQVLAGDAGSLPALLRAIDLAGFTIQHAGVTVQAPSAASQGIVFQAWEVQALNKLMRDKLVTSFGQAAALFATMTKETATVPFETLMYEGLRTNAAAKNQALRFWARFIAELGFQGPGAYDLLSNDPLTNVNMDAVQIAFIFKRLGGDLAAFARDRAPKPAKAPAVQPAVWTGGTASLVFASHRSPAPLTNRNVRSAPWDDEAGSSPCSLEGVAKEVSDIGAAADNFGFGQLMTRLEEKWGVEAAGKLAKATGVANMALVYVKLAATKALFNAKIEMDGAGPPLTRTQSTTANGARRKLTVTVKMDSSNAQWVNCLRPMINRMGLDFDMPNAGPVADAEVDWELVRPRPSTLGGVTYGIVQFVGGDPVHGGSNTTDALGRATGTDNKTNRLGQATIDIEGIKQRRAVAPSAQKVSKEAMVYAHVKLKPASLYQDLKDAVIRSGFSFDPLSGVVTMPAELMYRTNWLFGAGLAFEVIDWSQGFAGSIIVTEKGRNAAEKPGGADDFGFWNMSASYKDERTLTVTGSSEMSPYVPEVGFATATLNVSVNTVNAERYRCDSEGIVVCGERLQLRKHRLNGGTQRNSLSLNATSQQDRAVIVRIFADGHYELRISLDAEPQVGAFTAAKDKINGITCAIETITKDGPSKSKNRSIGNLLVTGVLDPNNPRVLKGQQILTDHFVQPKRPESDGCLSGNFRIGTTITVQWELAI
jgi:hypothetical protein